MELVSYEPPKDVAFGHDARVKDARVAWRLVDSFLKKWTRATLKDHIQFRCLLPFSGTCAVANEYRDYAAQKLGRGKEGEFGPWDIAPTKLSEALEVAFDEDKWARQSDGPADLSFSYTFQWKGETSEDSWLRVVVGRQRVFLAPRFVFPWAWDSKDFSSFLRKIEPDTPFRFREQYFRRLLPTKSGGVQARKLPKGWLK